MRLLVVTVVPPNAGLARMMARRSTSSMGTSAAARAVSGSRSRQRHRNGAAGACGAMGGVRLWGSQGGWKFLDSNVAMSAASGRSAVDTSLALAFSSAPRDAVDRVVHVRGIDDHVLDEDPLLRPLALEIGGQHVDAQPAPQHGVQLD